MTTRPVEELSPRGRPTPLSDDAVAPVTPPEVARPFEIPDTQILLGTSSFTASGWEGSFYPKGMKSTNYLSYYAKQFRTVEIDSTFYGTPSRLVKKTRPGRGPEPENHSSAHVDGKSGPGGLLSEEIPAILNICC